MMRAAEYKERVLGLCYRLSLSCSSARQTLGTPSARHGDAKVTGIILEEAHSQGLSCCLAVGTRLPVQKGVICNSLTFCELCLLAF